MWNFAPEVFERPAPSSDFERECTKIFFSMAVTDDDPEAAALSAAVTPRRPAAFRPRSVLEVVNALADTCAAAPTYGQLATVAREVLRTARQQLEAGADGDGQVRP